MRKQLKAEKVCLVGVSSSACQLASTAAAISAHLLAASLLWALLGLCHRYAFFDTDNVIEMAHPGEAVSDIFSKYGEDYFRDCESQVGAVAHFVLGQLCQL